MNRSLKSLATTAIVALSLGTAHAAPNYRCTFTYSGYTGTSTLTNFPALVTFAADNPKGFAYSQLKSGQTDLAFTDQNGTKLKYEVETWNEGGSSAIWVQIPELTKDSVVTATWGDPDATTTPTERVTTALWSDLGYAGVWHMNETTAGADALDATGNGLTATAGGADTSEMVGAAGAAGGARTIASSGIINYFSVQNNDALNALGTNFTIGCWLKATTVTPNGRVIQRKKGYADPNGWEIQWNGGDATKPATTPRGSSGSNDGSTALPSLANWIHVVWVYDGTTISTYANGAFKRTNTTASVTNNTQSLYFNKLGVYKGAYDEVRLIKGSRSADWIKAEYDTVLGTSFCTVSKVADFSALNKLTVETEIDATKGEVAPAFGTRSLTDAEVVEFSAPSDEFAMEDGRYLYYAGYRIYVTDGLTDEKLIRESNELTGSYTHTNGTSARLVWKQATRKGGASFDTAYSSLISIPGYTADETLHNIPVLVRIAENAPEGFHYVDVQEGGTDILFTDLNGHVLPHEIEAWDTNGTSIVWVNLPTLQAGMMFRFCYGNAEITTPQNEPSDVWADRGYAGVWHLGEAAPNGTETSADSTANGNTATPGGANTAQMVGTSGIAGGARTIATSSVINWLSVADADSLDLGDTFTASCWLKASSIAGNGRILEKKNGNWANVGWEIQWANADMTAPTMTMRGSTSDNNGKNVVSVGTSLANWTQLTFVYQGLDIKVYANGAYVGHSPITKAAANNTYALRFGSGSAYKGAYDEVRLVGEAATASRIKAEYDAIANAGFLSLGKAAKAGDANTFKVESADVERGTVTPAWGTTKNVEPGLLAFSAPEGTIPTASETNSFKFTGYSLFVTANGIETLVEQSTNLSGTYTHVAGQSARLVWSTIDMPQVKVTPTEGGTVSGTGYITIGTTATLTATPNEGYRFMGWKGTLPEGIGEYDTTISFVVDKAYDFTAQFAEATVTAGFFRWAGHAEGEEVTVESAANDIGTMTFAASSVTKRTTSGALPTFSKHHPAKTIYTDSHKNEVLATDPGSIFFTKDGTADVCYGSLGGWITRQKSCTIEFFFEAEAVGQYQSVYSFTHAGDTAIVFAPDSGNNVARYSIEASSNGHVGNVKGTLAATTYDSWHHAALVYDREAQTVTFYCDYQKIGTRTTAITETEGDIPLYFGSEYAYASRTSNAFRGWVSCLRVTKGTLEAREMMRAGFDDGQTDGTIAFYDFRGASGASAVGVKPKVGDVDAVRTMAATKGVAPIYTNDVPDTAIYANAAAVVAKKPLTKRHAALYCDAKSDLTFSGLASALSVCADYTIEMFVKPQSTGTWVVHSFWNDGGNNFIQLPGGDNKSLNLQTKSNGASAKFTPGTSALADGNWHHLAVTYQTSSNKYTVYYDRKQVGTIASAGHKESFTPFALATNYGLDGSSAFLGFVTGLRLTNRTLAPEEFLVAAPKPEIGFSVIVR